MVHIFTYGTLMFDPVWSRVVAGSYARCEAILPAYDRKAVREEVYPVIVPSSLQSQVQGVVYLDVSTSDLARLDQFEGEYYLRKTEQVVTTDKNILAAEVYVLKEEYFMIISPDEWDPVYFSTTGIHYFMHRYMESDKQ